MALTSRRNQILQMLREQKSAHVNRLAEYFHVTPTSIRRDLTYLEESGYITRSSGYAYLVPEPNILSINTRNVMFNEEKKRIAKAAAGLVADGSSILMDSGSSTLALTEQLCESGRRDLTIVTASIPIALKTAAQYQVLMSGGIVQAADFSFVGPDADSYFRSVTVDTVFIGATGVRENVGLTASSPFLCSLKKQMLLAARRSVALLDSSKFATNGVNLFCRFDQGDIDTIVTVRTGENEQQLERLEQMGIEIILA